VAAQDSTRALTVARLAAIDIAFAWRWVPVTVLGTVLLGYSVLPARFPTWDSPRTWLVSVAAVVACECGLLLHELGHALAARRSGQHVERIVFHGFVAETVLSAEPTHDVLVAVIGPATNLVLAAFLGALRLGFGSQEPLGALLVLLVLANLTMAAASLQPFGASDGARALRALSSRAPARERLL
jgi:Zn-dependent protease